MNLKRVLPFVGILIVVIIVVINIILGRPSVKYDEVSTPFVSGIHTHYEEVDITIDGKRIEGFYELGYFGCVAPIMKHDTTTEMTYLVNDELEIFTTIGAYSENYEEEIIDSVIRKLIFQYFEVGEEINANLREYGYETIWQDEGTYNGSDCGILTDGYKIDIATIHPNVSKYVQITNKIYTEALTIEEKESLVNAIFENDLNINDNDELYNVIEENIYELLGYEYSSISSRYLETSIYLNGSYVHKIDGDIILPLVYDIQINRSDWDDLYDNRRLLLIEKIEGYNNETMNEFNVYFIVRVNGYGYSQLWDYE